MVEVTGDPTEMNLVLGPATRTQNKNSTTLVLFYLILDEVVLEWVASLSCCYVFFKM